MKKFIVIFLLLALALPGAVFATEPAGSYETLQVEYRYAEGETPDIAPTIDRFGMTFHLVGQSDPMLEGSLPEVRTYRYRIDGYLTPAQIAQAEALGITLTPVKVDFEREVDKVDVVIMNTNDVDDIPKTKAFLVTSVKDPSGYEMKDLEYTGVTFERMEYEGDALPNGLKLPAKYEATVIYRGAESYNDVGYYYADAVFETYEVDGDVPMYVIIADYQSDMIAPTIVEEEEILPPIDEEEAEEVSTEDEELVAMVENQTGNPFVDIANGNVPLGNTNTTGVWSLLSFILSVAGIAIALIFTLGAVMRGRQVSALEQMGASSEEWLSLMKRRGIILRVLTIVVGVITLVTWLMLDDFTLGMVWINNHTITVGIMFAVTVALCILTNIRDKKIYSSLTKEEENNEGFATA